MGWADSGWDLCGDIPVFFFKQKTAYEMLRSLVGSEMCIRDSLNGRPTSRSNVAHFMTELIENTELWSTWKFRMPVIMNSTLC